MYEIEKSTNEPNLNEPKKKCVCYSGLLGKTANTGEITVTRYTI